ncbi:MAG: PEP-CTERM sorting domain-containing protein [Burkholderiaceae bacterium]
MIQFRSVARALMAGAFAVYVTSFTVSAQAATVVVEFEGVLLSQSGGGAAALDLDSTIIGVLTYDTDTPAINPGSTTSRVYNDVFEPFSSFSVYGADGTLLTQGASLAGASAQTTVTYGAANGVDVFNLNNSWATGDSFIVPAGGQNASPYQINFRLSDATGTTFDNGGLPTVLNLNSFDVARVGLQYRVGEPGAYTYATQTFTLTSLVVSPVPEPQAYALMAAGLGLVGAAVRRRSRKQAQ